MKKENEIQRQLRGISEADMHDIGSAFLKAEYGGDVHDIGKAAGASKTKPGKPDAYTFWKGKFYLAEYTTQNPTNKASFRNKLIGDLKSLLAPNEHGITLDEIEELLLICNSNVNVKLTKELQEIAKIAGKKLRVVGLTTLTHFLSHRGRVTARDILNISIDTGQVDTPEEFKEIYGRKGLGTTLKNELFGRSDDITKLLTKIKNHRVTIVKGAPGVGKTKIVLHAIDYFKEEAPSYKAFVIHKHHVDVYQNLLEVMVSGGNYIIFIDDANMQVQSLLDALNFMDRERTYNIKLVITVRDYAYEQISSKMEGRDIMPYNLEPLPASTLSAILRSPDFGLTNNSLVEKILNLSKGNARFAIIMAHVLKEDPNFNLENVVMVLDRYIHQIYPDVELFKEKLTTQVLGVMAFFETIDLADPKEMEILSHFKIDPEKFAAQCRQLENLEILEFRFDSIVKFPDQNLRTYFFYKAFFDDKALPFPVLLTQTMHKMSYRMKDSFWGADLAMGTSLVFNNVALHIEAAMIGLDMEDDLFDHYITVFGRYFPDKTFSYAEYLLEKIKTYSDGERQFSGTVHTQHIVHLVEPFLRGTDTDLMEMAVEMLIKTCQLMPAEKTRLANVVALEVGITDYDILQNCTRQLTLLNFIKNYKDDAETLKFLLSFMIRINLLAYSPQSFFYQEGPIWKQRPSFEMVRKLTWQHLGELPDKYKKEVMSVLFEYLGDVDKQHIQGVSLYYDYDCIGEYIIPRLNPEKFEDCYFVDQYYSIWKNKPRSTDIIASFQTESLKFYKTLAIPSKEAREIQEELNYDKEKWFNYHLNRISEGIDTSLPSVFKRILPFIEEISASPYQQNDLFLHGLDYYFTLIVRASADNGISSIKQYLKNGGCGRFNPFQLTIEIMKQTHKVISEYFQIVNTFEYPQKNNWIEHFFRWLPTENELIKSFLPKLLKHYQTTSKIHYIEYDQLEKFRVADPQIHQTVLTLITERRAADNSFTYGIWPNYFSHLGVETKGFSKIAQTAYLQSSEMNLNFTFDSTGKDLKYLLNLDPSFMIQYIKHHTVLGKSLRERNMHVIWDMKDCTIQIYEILDHISSIPEVRFNNKAQPLFTDLNEEVRIKAFKLLQEYLTDRITKVKSINLVLDIVRNRFAEQIPEMLRQLVSLNPDPKLFEKISWHNNHYMSTQKNDNWADYKVRNLTEYIMIIKAMPGKLKNRPYTEILQKELDCQKAFARHEFIHAYRASF